jgi:hypothetical protein
MAKYLTRPEVVAQFRLDFAPKVKEKHPDNEEELKRAWIYFKESLYKLGMIGESSLNWRYPDGV